MGKKYKVPGYVKSTHIPEKKTESMIIQHEILETSIRIKELIAKRKALKLQLKKLGNKSMPGKEYFERPIMLYALRLEMGHIYVGMTRDVDKRYKHHCKGKGSMWTRQYRPLEIIETRETGTNDDSEAGRLEDAMTIEYAKKFGTELVRGGGYCQRKPHWPDDIHEPDLSWIK